MISKLAKLPILKRLIPSVLIRILKILKKNRGYFKIKDVTMFLDFLDPIDRQIILFKEYESVEIKNLSKLIKKNMVTIFLDIGANCGYYSLFIAKKNPNLKILSYEPNNEAYLKLEKTLEKNSFFKNKINIFNYGLSDTKSKKILRSLVKFGYAQTGGSSTEKNYQYEQQANFEKGDDVLHFNKEKLAIKIDTEGHEIKVLKGIKNILKNNDCIIQIEIFDYNLIHVKNYLESLNYKLIDVYKTNSNYFFSKNN